MKISDINNLDEYSFEDTCFFNKMGLTSLKGLEKCTAPNINIGYNNLSVIDCDYNMPDVKRLLLSNNKLTGLNGIEKFPNLRRLIISNNPITSIQNISHLKHLEILTCFQTDIEDFSSLSKTKIKHLFISFTENNYSKILDIVKEGNIERINYMTVDKAISFLNEKIFTTRIKILTSGN